MTASPMSGIPPTSRRTASADVVRWRWQRLRKAGFDVQLADALAAERDVDLHALLDLVGKGCPPHLAARILGNQPTSL